MKKKILLLITILSFAALTLAAGSKRKVTALDGSKVDIPSSPQRIACFYHPAYDKIVMLSKGKRIALLPREASPWAYKFYPELRDIPMNTTGMVPDVERLLKLKVDLVMYPKGKVNVTKVSQAGISSVCPYNPNYYPKDIDAYTREFRRQVMFFGEVLGPEAKKRAGKYGRYLENITAKVKARTSGIPRSVRPRVYYGKVTDLYSTQGDNTIMKWYTELAGGIYLPGDLKLYFATVNAERVISWDPDIVLLGMYGSFNEAASGQALKMLRAGRSGKVYRIPAGIFFWDMTSCETALLPLYLGKKFHPDLFKDWDLIAEMKRFYSEIYGISVTQRDAGRILKGLPPL